MNCPKCKGKTKVTDSRPISHGRIRRRRECKACQSKFTTYENTINCPKLIHACKDLIKECNGVMSLTRLGKLIDKVEKVLTGKI